MKPAASLIKDINPNIFCRDSSTIQSSGRLDFDHDKLQRDRRKLDFLSGV
jgi:hypothetical protein